MSGRLTFTLWEQFGLKPPKAAPAPPPQWNADGTEHAIWKAQKDESDQLKELVRRQQKRLVEVTAELATRAMRGPVVDPIKNQKAKERKRAAIAAGLCRECGRKRERLDRTRCEMCAFINRQDCSRRGRERWRQYKANRAAKLALLAEAETSGGGA